MGGAGTSSPGSLKGPFNKKIFWEKKNVSCMMEKNQNDKNNNLPIGSSMTRAGFVRTRILIGTTKTI